VELTCNTTLKAVLCGFGRLVWKHSSTADLPSFDRSWLTLKYYYISAKLKMSLKMWILNYNYSAVTFLLSYNFILYLYKIH